MRRKTNFPVVLADGFSLSDTLNAPHPIAFKETVRENQDYSTKVYITRADGSDRRAVFDDIRHSLNCPLAWTPDGSTLFHSHDQIFAIDLADGSARAVTRFAEGEQAVWHLSCSPDGSTLAFLHFPPPDPTTGQLAPHRLCTIRADGSDFRVLVEQPEGYGVWQADVSWRTRQGVVSGIIPHQGTGFWKVGLDGGEVTQIGTTFPGAYDPALSPDGRQIAFCDICHGGIYVMDVADGQSRQVSRSGTNPSWSPDGQQIAFMYGDYELWTVSTADGSFQKWAWYEGRNYFPGSKPGRGGYAHTPLWSPDGRLLWFGLTKARRLHAVNNPKFLQQVKEDIAAGSYPYGGYTEAQRARALKDTEDRQHWDFVHKHCVIDFAERAVWVGDSSWANAAWGPVPT